MGDKTLGITAKSLGMSATQLRRGFYIIKFARKKYEELLNSGENPPIYPLYKRVREQHERFIFRVIEKSSIDDLSDVDIAEIASEYDLLTFPFDQPLHSESVR